MLVRTTMAHLRFNLRTEEDTVRLGRKLATLLPFSPRIWLHGELGAGKSTLARACLRGLGVTGAVKSPTYTLIERYPLEQGEAWHLDLYRIASPEELDYLGLDEADVRFWLIEWAERGKGYLESPNIEIFLTYGDEGGRKVEFLITNREIADCVTLWQEEFH